MSYYQRHLFICTNARNNPERKSCNDTGCGRHAVDYLKSKAHEMGLTANNRLRVNMSGCLNRCDEGPCMVVYPEGRWYTYHNDADLQEILERDLRDGEAVERLLLKD